MKNQKRWKYKSIALLFVLMICGYFWLSWISPAIAGAPIVDPACTSFCLDNGDQAVFGTNYDNQIWEGLLFVNPRGVTKSGWEAGTSGKYARWTAEYGSVTFNLAGTQMVWAGMNEAGLTISTMWLGETENPEPDERPPLVSALWIQYQLDTCATIAEVMANDARVRIVDTVDHYLVCDRSGACAAVEFLEGKTVFHAGDAMPLKTLTNHAYQKAIQAWQAKRLRGDNSLERFGIAADRVSDFQPGEALPAVDYAFEILDRASGQATGGSPTQWSIVFDTQNLRVHFRTSRNPQIRSLDFSRLNFDCGSPVQMLDVHAPLSGDISDKLGQFTFDANLQHTLNFLNKWENMQLSALEVEVLERGLASFPCEKTAAAYQEESTRVIPPLVSWVALALLYRFWPVGIILGLGVVALAVWRVRRM
ncbi:MAG: linear amide C-N hydrolase [Anaerolineales bacterium]|jgi:penicillin V acylase-like amidase (Ntn superfamily)